MINKLKIEFIFQDFIKKVCLTNEQIKLLDMYRNKETRVKISNELGMSERTIGYELAELKKLYKDYCDLEITKATILKK